jgi:hypothetical protein
MEEKMKYMTKGTTGNQPDYQQLCPLPLGFHNGMVELLKSIPPVKQRQWYTTQMRDTAEKKYLELCTNHGNILHMGQFKTVVANYFVMEDKPGVISRKNKTYNMEATKILPLHRIYDELIQHLNHVITIKNPEENMTLTILKASLSPVATKFGLLKQEIQCIFTKNVAWLAEKAKFANRQEEIRKRKMIKNETKVQKKQRSADQEVDLDSALVNDNESVWNNPADESAATAGYAIAQQLAQDIHVDMGQDPDDDRKMPARVIGGPPEEPALLLGPRSPIVFQPKVDMIMREKLCKLNEILGKKGTFTEITKAWKKSKAEAGCTGITPNKIQSIVGAMQVFISSDVDSYWMTDLKMKYYTKDNLEHYFINKDELYQHISTWMEAAGPGMKDMKIAGLSIIIKNGKDNPYQQPCHIDCEVHEQLGHNQEWTGTMLLGMGDTNTYYWDLPDVGIVPTKDNFSNSRYGWDDCPSPLLDKIVGNSLFQKYGRVLFANPELKTEMIHCLRHQITLLPGYVPHCGPAIDRDFIRSVFFWSFCSHNFAGETYDGTRQMSRECLIFAMLDDHEAMGLDDDEVKYLLQKGILYFIQNEATGSRDTTFRLDDLVIENIDRIHYRLLDEMKRYVVGIQNQKALLQKATKGMAKKTRYWLKKYCLHSKNWSNPRNQKHQKHPIKYELWHISVKKNRQSTIVLLLLSLYNFRHIIIWWANYGLVLGSDQSMTMVFSPFKVHIYQL